MPLLSFLTLLTTFNNGNYTITSSSVVVKQAFDSYGLTLDLVPAAPPNYVMVSYGSRLLVLLGNVMQPDQVLAPPLYVAYYACPERYYTLFLLDNISILNGKAWLQCMDGLYDSEVVISLEIQSKQCQTRRQGLLEARGSSGARGAVGEAQRRLWHVGNIPADDVWSGETLATYVPPRPESRAPTQLYTFLVYRQRQKLAFSEPRLLNTTGAGRTGFSLTQYAAKYELTLIAGNVLQVADGRLCRQGAVPLAPL